MGYDSEPIRAPGIIVKDASQAKSCYPFLSVASVFYILGNLSKGVFER